MASESANGGLHDEEKTQTIRLFGSHEAAEIAAAKLNANGFQCWLTADDCAGMYPSLTAAAGVRLKVRVVDVEAATALLDSLPSPAEKNQLEDEALASAPEEKIPLKKLAWGQIFIGIGIGVFLCWLLTGKSKMGNKTYYSYTADGKCYEAMVYKDAYLKAVYRDRNLDGKWDARFYYQQGNVLRSEYDNNFDGQPDEFCTYSNTLPVTYERDTDFNGVSDLFCTCTNGVIQQADYRPNGIKFTTTREIFKNGVMTEIWRGGDSHGNFKVVEKYNPFFLELEEKNLYSNPASINEPTPFQLLSPTAK